MLSSAPFMGAGRGRMSVNETGTETAMEIEHSAFGSFDPSSAMSTSSSPPFVVSTPGSSTCASSYDGVDGSDSDDENEDDAMVDAAMAESGLLTSALLSEDHIGLDTMLLDEMDRLTAKEGSTHWNQYHHFESHVAPASPATMTLSIGLGPQHIVPASPGGERSPRSFMPSGTGWAVHGVYASPDGNAQALTDDTEMEDAEPPESRLKQVELLVRQVKFLEAQRDFLDYEATLKATSDRALETTAIMSHRDALLETRRLLDAQLYREMLLKLAKQQLESLKYAELQLLQTPLNHYRMTLMTPMEAYIHLTRDPAERRATLMALRDEKLDMTRRFIDFQSQNIDIERPFLYMDTFEKFGKFYAVDFSISKLDGASVDDAVNVIYNHFVSSKDTISQALGSVENREYFDGIEWTFLNARFVDRINLPRSRSHTRGFVVQESNTVYYMKRVGDTVLMTSDFIDKDDLHPYRATGRIRKDSNVGVIIEPYVDAQGKQSVVMKRFSFAKHDFKNIRSTPDLIHAISTRTMLWGQALRFSLASRKAQPTTPAVINPEFLSRAARITELASSSAPQSPSS